MDDSTPASRSEFSDLSRDELEAQITELAGQLNAATHRWLTLIGEFDRRGGWSDGFLPSCAHWLNFKCGLNLGAAREKVRVAHAIETLPKIASSMSRGELSYSKVRALTRVATPATEDALLMIALHGTAHHVETVVRHFRRAQDAQALSREAHQQATRCVHYWYDCDGSLVLKARLPALSGALFVKALELSMSTDLADRPPPRADDDDDDDVEDDREHSSYVTRRADALTAIAEAYLDNLPPAVRTADRFQVVVHVDAETLRDGVPGRCHVDHGPTLPVETARRLTCDASLVRIVETETGEPLDVGRKTRAIPASIRRALNARDTGCCFPGCTSRSYLDAHHVRHWADGGETKLSNLVSLCRTHHRRVHEGGIRVESHRAGGWRFVRADGREIPGVRADSGDTYAWSEITEFHAREGVVIDHKTAATRWCGERIDYGHTVWVLCLRADRERRADVSAETFGIRGTAPLSDPDCYDG